MRKLSLVLLIFSLFLFCIPAFADEAEPSPGVSDSAASLDDIVQEGSGSVSSFGSVLDDAGELLPEQSPGFIGFLGELYSAFPSVLWFGFGLSILLSFLLGILRLLSR